MTRIIKGELEIDPDRGVIYFHAEDEKIIEKYGSVSILRICRIPTPIPERAIDITLSQTGPTINPSMVMYSR